jgi:hypothetical protein
MEGLSMKKKVVSVVGAALMVLTAMGGVAHADGTGGRVTTVRSMPRITKAEDLRQINAKLALVQKIGMQKAKREGSVSTNSYVGGPPSSYYLAAPTIPQMPVLNDDGSADPRYCVHCGVASTLIALRFLKSVGSLNIDDLSTFSNGRAIKKLGDGYLNGTNTGYAIMVQDSQGVWGGNQFQMRANLNTRRKSDNLYILSNSNSYATPSQLSDSLKYSVWADQPVVLLVNTRLLTYYKGNQYGHFVVVDGYDTNGAFHRLNDPNNCSRTAVNDRLFGQHRVLQDDTKNALDAFGVSNILW